MNRLHPGLQVFRHFRFFTAPVPACIQWLEYLDGIVQVGLPGLFLSGAVLLLAALIGAIVLARRE